MTTHEVCPHCKGKCCRNDGGYRVKHMGAEYYDHYCEHCETGDKYVPPPDHAQMERATVVAYLRARANAPHPIERGIPSLSPAGRGLLLLMADQIEKGEHLKQENE
jgi:hypothetical protein